MKRIDTERRLGGMLRLVAVILPAALLAACGGGGGGGAVVTSENPPAFRFNDAQVEQARSLVGGNLPDNNGPTPQELAGRVVDIAEMSNALLFSQIGGGTGIDASRMITCTPGQEMCDAVIDEGGGAGTRMEMQALEEIDGPVLFDNGENHEGYNGRYAVAMTDNGIPLVQASAAGRLDGVRYEYQGYGGWLDHSVFVIQSASGMSEGVRVFFHSAYSFGNASETNPTSSATWSGVMVGTVRDGGDILQGDASVQLEEQALDKVVVSFDNIKNLTENSDADPPELTWDPIPLANGAFKSVDDTMTGSIWGNFYGDNYEEVGGIFDRDDIIGAFGAKRDGMN